MAKDWCTPLYFARQTGWSLEAVKLTLSGRKKLGGKTIDGAEFQPEQDLDGGRPRWRIPTRQIRIHVRPGWAARGLPAPYQSPHRLEERGDMRERGPGETGLPHEAGGGGQRGEDESGGGQTAEDSFHS